MAAEAQVPGIESGADVRLTAKVRIPWLSAGKNPDNVLDHAGQYDFRFVQVGEPSQTRAENSRSVIRAHVMRDFYGKRQGKIQPYQADINSSASSNQSSTQQKHRFKIGPKGLQELKPRRRDSEPAKLENSSSTRPNSTIGNNADTQPFPSLTAQPDDTCDAGPCCGPAHGGEITVVGQWSTDQGEISAAECRIGAEISLLTSPTGSILGNGLLDPFDTLPLPKSPRTKVLLYHGKWL